MIGIRHQSITSEEGKPIGVILDMDTFQRVESIIEDHGLAHLMDDVSNEEELGREDAINMYKSSVAGLKHG